MIKAVTKVGVLAASVLFALALVPNEAEARPKAKGAYGKPWRLHFESEFLGVSHFDRDGGDMDADDSQTNFGFGISRPSALDDGGLLLFTRPLIGVGFGYAFLDERLIVGGKVALTVDTIDIGTGDSNTVVGGRLVPYIQWMFLPGRWARPYVEARVGFGGTASSSRVDNPVGDDIKQTVHVIYPVVGVGGGVHLFPVDYFSVDLGLNFDYAAPHTRQTFSDHPPDDTEWDKAGDFINFGVLLGASVWFG